jgi:adenylate cyclase
MPPHDQSVARKLAAIFMADVEGYSRLMGSDEVATLRILTNHREVMDRLIDEYGGRIANTAGDSVLAEFPSVVDAVQCATEVQEALAEANEVISEESRLQFRIGVHVGDVLVRGGDLFGDGVNIAARLQALAEPGGVCISGEAYRYVGRSLLFTYIDLGSQEGQEYCGTHPGLCGETSRGDGVNLLAAVLGLIQTPSRPRQAFHSSSSICEYEW